MANDKLENLVRIRQLKAEPVTAEEIAGLQRSGENRLTDSTRPTENETLRSMKVTLMSMTSYSKH